MGGCFGLAATSESSEAGSYCVPGGELDMLGTYGKFGPGRLFYGADFSFYKVDHQVGSFFQMPVVVQGGYLLDLPVLKPYIGLEAGGVNTTLLADTGYTVWGFQAGADLGSFVMLGPVGISALTSVGLSSVPLREDADPYSDNSLDGISYRWTVGLSYSWSSPVD